MYISGLETWSDCRSPLTDRLPPVVYFYRQPTRQSRVVLRARKANAVEPSKELETFNSAALWSIAFRDGTSQSFGYDMGTPLWILFAPETMAQRRARRLAEGRKQLVQVNPNGSQEHVNHGRVYDLICALVRYLDEDQIACADQGLTRFKWRSDLAIDVEWLRVLQRSDSNHSRWVSLNGYNGLDAIPLALGERLGRFRTDAGRR